MATQPKNFTVFYSWQTEIPHNVAFLRKGLNAAAEEVQRLHPSWKVIIDEATRDETGSVNIPMTIQDKLRVADMFVGDITTTNAGTQIGRPAPNANVTFELGYAVAVLGWRRSMTLFNIKYGNFPDDVPFDFDRHRISKFRADEKPTKDQTADLVELLTAAIESTLRKAPARPTDEKTPEERRRIQDTSALRWVLSTLNLPLLDKHIPAVPFQIETSLLKHWDWFDEVMQDSRFHLHDEKLAENFRVFHEAFGKTVGHDELYRDTLGGKLHVLDHSLDRLNYVQNKKTIDEMKEAAREMYRSLGSILEQVRSSFVEIDLNETTRTAAERYVEMRRRI